MSKIKSYLLLVFPLVLASCNLDYFPQDEVTSESLAQNYEGLCTMTDGNYAMLKDNMEYHGTSSTSYTFCRRGLEMAEYSSDELIISGRTTSTIFQAYTYERDATLQNVSYVWWCLYKCIYGANMVIEAIEDGDSPEKDYLKGENLFLRAFCHLYLCNLYAWPYSHGRENPGVVIRTSTNTEETKRATVGQVYDQIVQDLTEAARLMKNGTKRGNNGYASYDAVMGLLSRAYLHMEENEKVIETVKEMLGGASPESKLMSTAEYPTYFANTLTARETLWCIAYTSIEGASLGQSLFAGMLLNDGIGWGEAFPTDAQLDIQFLLERLEPFLDIIVASVFQHFIKDGLKVAYAILKDADAIQQALVNLDVNRVLNDKVVDVDLRRGLAETVDTANALFDNHRVPGQVVVDHSVAELHVQAFTTHFR